MIVHNVSVFSPNRSHHSLNITKKNLVKVFPKDTLYGNGSGVAGGGMLNKEEIMELLEKEEQAEQEWRNGGYLIEQQEHQMRLDQEALIETMAEEARAKQEEEERLRKEREEAWELGLYGYVSDSYTDSSEERFRIEPEEDWELGWCGYVSDSFTDTD